MSLLANKPRQWKSMLSTNQGGLIWSYNIPLLVSQITEFVICIFIYIRDITLHITTPSEKSRPETWPGNNKGNANLGWQLTLSNS